MTNDLSKVLSFIENDEGYDREELIALFTEKIEMLKGNYLDEIMLVWGDPNDGEELGTLEDFAKEFQDLILEGVCNVIKTFMNDKGEE